jgi:predicted small lipoprotein YifL
MKRIVRLFCVVLLAFSLVGCTSAGKLPNFPDVPVELEGPCQDLSTANPDIKFSGLLEVITDNYFKYHECKLKVDMWNLWYKNQKQIYEGLK